MKERTEITVPSEITRTFQSNDKLVTYVEGMNGIDFIEGSRLDERGRLVDIFVSYDPNDLEQALDVAENSGKGVRGHVVVMRRG